MNKLLFAAALLAASSASAFAADCKSMLSDAQSAYRMYMDEVRRVDALPPLNDNSTRDVKVAVLDEFQNASTMGHWLLDTTTAAVTAHCANVDIDKMTQSLRLTDLALKRGREKLAAEDAESARK